MSTVIVAFQGEHGAYSEEAVRQHFGRDVETLPCPNFQRLFEAALTREATYGMLPVENALAGTVAQSYELLFEHDMRVQAEVILRVQHMLLAPAGTKLADIKRVKSHPQALAQCEGYLRRRGFEAVVAYDTAGSARDLAAHPEPQTAAIASALAGKLYNLDVLESGIEDQKQNYTRFLMIGHGDPEPGDHNKTTVVFAVKDRPGALYECLGEFATRGINLTKIESRPRKGKPWQYYFYLDIEGHANEPACEAALSALLRRAAMLKLLGSYPATKMPADERNE